MLDKFNKKLLVSKLKLYKKQVEERERLFNREIEAFLVTMSKYDPEYIYSACRIKDLIQMAWAVTVSRYKYNEIRLFLQKYYGVYPEVATALVFHPSIPL
jgi:hypothetical protein